MKEREREKNIITETTNFKKKNCSDFMYKIK